MTNDRKLKLDESQTELTFMIVNYFKERQLSPAEAVYVLNEITKDFTESYLVKQME